MCCVWWWCKEGKRWNPMPAHSLLISKNTKGAARLNVPIRRTSRYQQYNMPSQHIYCRRVWNLIQICDYNLAIRKCTSPPLLAPRLKIFKWKFTTPPGVEPRTCWIRGKHATIWASAASLWYAVKIHNFESVFVNFLRNNTPKRNPLFRSEDKPCKCLLFSKSKSDLNLNNL